MYCILYEFRPVPGEETAFLATWKALTAYIHEQYGSLGSRMHRSASGRFIAYAQWPSQAVHDGVVATEEGKRLQEAMRRHLQEDGVTVLEKLEVVEDCLVR